MLGMDGRYAPLGLGATPPGAAAPSVAATPGLGPALGPMQFNFKAAPPADQENINQQMSQLSTELASLQRDCGNKFQSHEKNELAQQMLRLTKVIEALQSQVR